MSAVVIRRALISVSDKSGIDELGRALAGLGVEILSTGGTRARLEEAGVGTVAISDYTGAPEILDGRVKTLHPKVHGGLLGRATEDHRRQMREQGIEPIDLVVVNLYPFEQTVARGAGLAETIEQIDIGGPSMLRSAAKNFERVAVVVDPADYRALLDELASTGGAIGADTRAALARKAFAHTAAYDSAIAAYLTGDDSGYPGTLGVQWSKVLDLRYGENPHQSAAFYRTERSPMPTTAASSGRPSLADAEILQGKALSYNNILDLDGALGACLEFERPCAVVVKHTNPCGVACADSVADAYRLARETDPVSAFGGIVAVNREVDLALAEQLAETFLECVIAPGYSAEARHHLSAKKNLRLAALPWTGAPGGTDVAMRSVLGGLLVQSADIGARAAADAEVVTERAPTADELAALDFAWRVCKHVKSNAILFCHRDRTAAVGAGQMSRVDAARVAQLKAQLDLAGSVVASDAFFPFRDGIDVLAEAGATAVIQPGGSVRDDEVIAAANERGMAMLFTRTRHFRH
jgi:phosphoribosylaminoimidazolecarboxamide formyltransferase/IMP cyclohydrolase